MADYNPADSSNAAYDAGMASMRAQDSAQRDFITQRQLRNAQSQIPEQTDTQQTAAGGTPAGTALPASPPATPVPADTSPADATGGVDASAQPAPNNSNSILVSESNRRLQAMKASQAANGPTREQVDQAALLRLPAAAADVVTTPLTAGRNLFGAGVAAAQNGVGKVVNAIAGSKVLPTDTDYGYTSTTPYTDRLVAPTMQAANRAPDEAARLKQLQAQDASTQTGVPANAGTSVADRFNNPGNLKFAGQPGATAGPKLPDGTSFAVFPDMDAGLAAAQNQLALDMSRGTNTVQGLITKWSPPGASGNSAASTNAYITRVASQLGVSPTQPLTPDSIPKMAQVMYGVEAGHPNGTRVPTNGAQPAATPQQQAPATPGQSAPVQPVTQGPTFYADNGTPFTVPGQYTDGMVAHAQQQAEMATGAAHMAWLRLQAAPTPENQAAYQNAFGQVQQLHQGLYDMDIYAKTQQAQAGNPQAFSALLNEYSNKVGQPVQVVPGTNGMYALKSKSGQLIAQGDPAYLAGTLGGVLNSNARANSMKIAQIKAEAAAKAQGEEEAKMPSVLAKLQTDLRMKLSENDTALLKQAVENNKPSTVQLTGGQVVYVNPSNKASPIAIVDPNKLTKSNGALVQQPLLQQ